MSILPIDRARQALPEMELEPLTFLRDTVVTLWESATRRLWDRRVAHVQEINLDERYLQRKRFIYPELYPIETILVREFDDEEDVALQTDLVAGTDYVVRATKGEIKRLTKPQFGVTLNRDANWKENVRLTITGGYGKTPAAEIPAEITRALMAQLTFMAERLNADRVALSSQSISFGGTNAASQFLQPAHWQPLFRQTVNRKMLRARW